MFKNESFVSMEKDEYVVSVVSWGESKIKFIND